MNFPSRFPEVGTSIFTVMSKMVLEHGAINLSQGFPDFPVYDKIIELIYANLKAGNNQYALIRLRLVLSPYRQFTLPGYTSQYCLFSS